MRENVPADNNKFSKQVLIDCTPEQAQAIVQPLVAMSVLMMGLGQRTKPKEIQEHAARLATGKEALCRLMESRLNRSFWPDRLSGFYLASSAHQGGAFDLTFTETTPSKEGNLASVFKIRLIASRQTLQERAASFVQSNNPLIRGQVYDLARQVIQATGM